MKVKNYICLYKNMVNNSISVYSPDDLIIYYLTMMKKENKELYKKCLSNAYEFSYLRKRKRLHMELIKIDNETNKSDFILKKVFISKFKCFKNFEFNFSEQKNIIIGLNGSGKSTFIEAIFMIFLSFELGVNENDVRFDYVINYFINNSDVGITKEKSYYNLIFNGESIENLTLKQLRTYLSEFKILPNKILSFCAGYSDKLLPYYKKYVSRKLAESNSNNKKFEHNNRVIHCLNECLPVYLLISLSDEDGKRMIEKYCGDLEIITFVFKIKRKSSDDLKEWANNFEQLIKSKNSKLYDLLNFKYKYNTGIFLKQFDLEIEMNTFSIINGDLDFKDFLDWIFFVLLFCENVDAKVKRKKVFDIYSLSEGQQQWIKLIGMLIIGKWNGGLMFLDEPDAFMNPVWKYDIYNTIESVLTKSSFSILSTHEPLVINGVKKESIHIFDAENGHVIIKKPIHDTKGLGIDGILKSEYYGLNSSYDLESTQLLNEREILFIKLINEGLTTEEKNRYKEIIEQTQIMPLTFGSLNFLYYDFLNVYKNTKYYGKQYLSYEEYKNRENQIKNIISGLFEEDS